MPRDATDPFAAPEILGPVLVGTCAGLVLYGILLSTFYSFVHTPPWHASSTPARLLVLFIVLLTTAATGLQIADLWHLATRHTDYVRGTLEGAVEPLLVGVVGAAVETILGFKAARILGDWRRWVFLALTGSCLSVGLLASIGATAWGVTLFNNSDLALPHLPSYNTCVAVWLWSSCLVNTIITSIYIVQLRKRMAGFNEMTDTALQKVMNLAIQSALHTAVFTFIGAVLSVAFTHDNILRVDVANAFWLPLPSLYTLSLFTTLSVPSTLSSHFKATTLRIPRRTSLTTHFDARHSSPGSPTISTVPYNISFAPPPSAPSPSHSRKHSRNLSMSSIRNPLRFASAAQTTSDEEKSEGLVDGVTVQVELHVEEDRLKDGEEDGLTFVPRLQGTRIVEMGPASPGARTAKLPVAMGGSRGIRRPRT